MGRKNEGKFNRKIKETMVIRLLPHFMQKVIESKVHEFSEIFIGYKLCLEKNGRNVA